MDSIECPTKTASSTASIQRRYFRIQNKHIYYWPSGVDSISWPVPLLLWVYSDLHTPKDESSFQWLYCRSKISALLLPLCIFGFIDITTFQFCRPYSGPEGNFEGTPLTQGKSMHWEQSEVAWCENWDSNATQWNIYFVWPNISKTTWCC